MVLGPRRAPGQPRPLEMATLRARFDLALALHRAGSALALEKKPIPVDTTPLRIRGTVGESLYRSARAAGAPPQTIQEYLQALDGHISLEGDVQPSDQFDLVFAMKRAATGETEVGNLLYAGLARGNRPVAELLRWGNDGSFYAASSFSTESVVQTGSTGLLMPVSGRITSSYGQRFHPILGYARMHAGVDFGARWGSPIVATAAGVVTFAGGHGGHGNYVRLDHGGGLGTGYAHMSRIAVAPGERVSAGEIIGYVGSTGLSTGPHLHYEMYRGGRTVNPLGMAFATVTRQVDTRDLDAFRARLVQMKAVKPGGLLATAQQKAPRIAMR
jgi:murein DD-endopeptidase MepM/ murein hydrolase activator NlpD